MALKKMKQVAKDRYEAEDGTVMQREKGKTPNGNEFDNRWVLRDPDGNLIDFDQYRNDLAGRYHWDINIF